ncbi:MAG: PG0541 family transporter-associated protein [Bacteroidales bacterium]
MKAVFIAYNQALTDRVNRILDRENVRGYTKWDTTYGRGSFSGEPHMGTHTWPAMNSSIIAITDELKAQRLLEKLRELDAETERQGLRAFVWNVEDAL